MKSNYKKVQIPADSKWDRKIYNPFTLLLNWIYKYRNAYIGHYVYRAFSSIENFIKGVKTIIKWMPYTYKDRDWDYNFIYEMLQRKIQFTRDHIVKNNRHTGVEASNYWMTVVLNLIDAVKNEEYSVEYFKYIKKHHNFDLVDEKDENGGNLYELNSRVVYDKTYKYVKLNPSKARLLSKSNPEFKNMDDEDKAREIGQAKHEQAKKLIFMILERKIEYWWD